MHDIEIEQVSDRGCEEGHSVEDGQNKKAKESATKKRKAHATRQQREQESSGVNGDVDRDEIGGSERGNSGSRYHSTRKRKAHALCHAVGHNDTRSDSSLVEDATQLMYCNMEGNSCSGGMQEGETGDIVGSTTPEDRNEQSGLDSGPVHNTRSVTKRRRATAGGEVDRSGKAARRGDG